MKPHAHSEGVGCAGSQNIEQADMRDQGLGMVVVPDFRIVQCEKMPQDILEVHQALVSGHLEQL